MYAISISYNQRYAAPGSLASGPVNLEPCSKPELRVAGLQTPGKGILRDA